MMQQVKVNTVLCKLFLKHMKLAGSAEYCRLFTVLRGLLENDEAMRVKEKEVWAKRREYIRKMNPKMDLKYRSEILKREDFITSPLYQTVLAKAHSFLLNSKGAYFKNVLCLVQLLELQGSLPLQFLDLTFAMMEQIKEMDFGDARQVGTLTIMMNLLKRLIRLDAVKASVEARCNSAS